MNTVHEGGRSSRPDSLGPPPHPRTSALQTAPNSSSGHLHCMIQRAVFSKFYAQSYPSLLAAFVLKLRARHNTRTATPRAPAKIANFPNEAPTVVPDSDPNLNESLPWHGPSNPVTFGQDCPLQSD
jgi:hypothetical protein